MASHDPRRALGGDIALRQQPWDSRGRGRAGPQGKPVRAATEEDMGLFKFIKDAGAKLFGASAATAATAETLQKEIASHGLPSNVQVSVNGDRVSVSGSGMSNEEAEKIILALGNTVGVAEVESNLLIDAAVPPSVFYTVKKGDTLWKIAEEHYGKGKGAKYTEIVAANTPPVKNPDLIQPGWVLRIPPLG
jgi:nucleoid-associated protein YgaU